MLNVYERIVSRVGAGMEIPGVVNGPKLIGWNELLQAFVRGYVLIIALLRAGSACSSVAPAEPVGWRPPTVRALHVNAVPLTLAASVLGEGRDGVHHSVLPVQVGENAMIRFQDGIGREAVASIGPNPHGGVVTKH